MILYVEINKFFFTESASSVSTFFVVDTNQCLEKKMKKEKRILEK